jgi:hypothetical protein
MGPRGGVTVRVLCQLEWRSRGRAAFRQEFRAGGARNRVAFTRNAGTVAQNAVPASFSRDSRERQVFPQEKPMSSPHEHRFIRTKHNPFDRRRVTLCSKHDFLDAFTDSWTLNARA